MSLLLALTSGAAPAVDLLCPALDDGGRKRQRADSGWHPGILQVDAVPDLLYPGAQEASKRKRRADAWQAFLAPDVGLFQPVLDDGRPRRRIGDEWAASAPDAPAEPVVDLFAGMLDDGAAASRNWGDEFTAALPPDADVFGSVLDDGFVRGRAPNTLHAYLPPDVETQAPLGQPPDQPAASPGGGHARKLARAYDRNQQIKRQNEAILAIVIAAVTSGALE